jgi:type 1 fimbria pilin
MVQSGSTIENGTIIGKTNASIGFNFPITTGNNSKVISGISSGTNTNIYNAVPLPNTPGVGVVVKWGGYYTQSNIRAQQLNIGGAITSNQTQNLFDAIATSTYDVIFSYTYELVVIDKTKYQGGKLSITGTSDALIVTGMNNVAGLLTCKNGSFYLLSVITGELNVPELPKPAKPTCTSTNLGYTVPLNSIKARDIASYGSVRSEGTESERDFRLIGYNCSAGTVIKAYLTDNRAPSATKNYLNSTNSNVGVRIYNYQSQKPVVFGPAPIGSSMPTHDPIVEGPASSDLDTMYIFLTAQYVRLQGVTVSDVKPGKMQAAATVTFVYE